jgi:hypothetical protein
MIHFHVIYKCMILILTYFDGVKQFYIILLLNAVVPVNPEYEPLRMTAKNDLVGCRLLQEVLHLEWKCTEVFVLQI